MTFPSSSFVKLAALVSFKRTREVGKRVLRSLVGIAASPRALDECIVFVRCRLSLEHQLEA